MKSNILLGIAVVLLWLVINVGVIVLVGWAATITINVIAGSTYPLSVGIAISFIVRVIIVWLSILRKSK